MLIDHKDAERRLNSASNIANKFARGEVRHETHRTAGRNKQNVPEEIRETTGALARAGVPQKELADALGVSQAAVSYWENGKTSPNQRKESLEKGVADKTERIRDTALNKLMATLGLIDDEKLANCDAKDLTRVAVGLSQVAANTAPRERNDGHSAAVQVVVYAPPQRDEERFKVIDA